VWDKLLEKRLEVGEKLQISLDGWARDLSVNRQQLTAALRGLEDRGAILYLPADRVGGVELLTPGAPLSLDEARMKVKRNRAYAKLDKMVGYATSTCRRRYVIEYFGETAPFEQCGTCDACRGDQGPADAPRALAPNEQQVVVKVLATLARMERHTGKSGFPTHLIAKTATGSKAKAIKAWGFDRLSTYGILGPGAQNTSGVVWSVGEISDIVAELVRISALHQDYATRKISGKQRTYKEVSLTDLGWTLMRSGAEDVHLTMPHAHKLVRKRPASAPASAAPTELLARLRDVRTQLASRKQVPAYVVASNRTLDEMARLRPLTKRAMLGCHGMGEVRMKRYGGPFLEVLRSWAAEKG